MPHDHRSLVAACATALQDCDQLHFLSVLGAMQLIPGNMHLTAALERLVQAAVTLPQSAVKGRSRVRLRPLVTIYLA